MRVHAAVGYANADATSILCDHDPGRGAALRALAGDFVPDAGGHIAEDQRVRVFGLGDRDRGAAVGGFADLEVERHLAQKLDAEAVALLAAAPGAEVLSPARATPA